ncbi:DUF4064 domain-containing protein [Bacillus sp. FSL W7-1360]
MKRTGERVLGKIGISFSVLGLLFFGLASFVDSAEYFMPTVGSFIATIAGMIAVKKLHGQPKVAGILMLSSAVMYGVMVNIYLLLVLTLIPPVLYTIAGMMALVRKGVIEQHVVTASFSEDMITCMECGTKFAKKDQQCPTCEQAPTDEYAEQESYGSILGYNLFLGSLLYLYSIPNIFYVYMNDTLRLFAIFLCLSYFVVIAGASYIEYRAAKKHYSKFVIILWSFVAVNLYGIQALVAQPFFQEVYIYSLWGQLCLLIIAWMKWITVSTRKSILTVVVVTLVVFLLFHSIGSLSSSEGTGGLYAFLFGHATQTPIWPGFSLFFSIMLTCIIMNIGIELDITPEERARMEEERERAIAEEVARAEARRRKVSDEMLSSGRYLEYGELEYLVSEGLNEYRAKGSKTFEYVEVLYAENGVRYFSRTVGESDKEMILYQENDEWYCQTSGEEPEPVLLPDWVIETEDEWRQFEVNKRQYLEKAIQYRLEIPCFVKLPDDIDESRVSRY